jgi:Ca-activated chloride channel homolog
MRMLIWIEAASLVPLTAVLAAGVVQSPAFRARTDLVAMTVTVLDDKGVPVPDLPQGAFTVTEDGRARPIAQFANGGVPISIVVALDASESMKGSRFDGARQAVKGFLSRLGPEDEFTVIGFNDQPFSISPWSTSRQAIIEALDRVEPQGYTALYAAVSSAIDGLRGSRNRRQALVIVSDGNDQLRIERPGTVATKLAARQRSLPAIERVQRSEAVVYAIAVEDPHAPAVYALDTGALRDLTDPSGGSTRTVDTYEGITAAADRIGAELRQQYVLGFAPAHPADGKFHKVQVSVSGCATCKVHVRSGYIAERTADR